MRLFKTKWFHRWAAKEGLSDAALRDAAAELVQGLADALGGYVYKKRIADTVVAMLARATTVRPTLLSLPPPPGLAARPPAHAVRAPFSEAPARAREDR